MNLFLLFVLIEPLERNTISCALLLDIKTVEHKTVDLFHCGQ